MKAPGERQPSTYRTCRELGGNKDRQSAAESVDLQGKFRRNRVRLRRRVCRDLDFRIESGGWHEKCLPPGSGCLDKDELAGRFSRRQKRFAAARLVLERLESGPT